jgi:PKD repeat protein
MKIKFAIILLILGSISEFVFSQGSENCIADFNYSVDYEISPFTYNFIDSSSSSNTIVEWDWDFGNSNHSELQNPNHQFLNQGEYAVTLVVKDNIGCRDTITKMIVVENSMPPNCSAYFTFLRDTSSANYTYKFTDHSIHTNDSIISWEWDFGDSSPLSSIQHPIHQYSSTGTYDVRLDIQTINGCSSFYIATIIINTGGLNCNASFTYSNDTASSQENTILFHDNSIFTSPIVSWKWYFGDGDSSSYQDPSHHFPFAGIYNVKLKIVTSDCESEIEIPVQVGNPQKYNLWGRVYVGNLTTDKCVAYLFKEYSENYVVAVDTVTLTSVNDSLGVYYFYQVDEGNYKVQVVLPSSSNFYENYAPTYFDNSVLWHNSQTINLFSDKSLQNVHMQSVLLQIGTNYISGSVINQANTQLEGLTVFLINTNGDIINYTYSDVDGNYSFDEVPQGDYYVYGDLAGFASYPASLNFSTNNDSLLNINIIIKGRAAVGIIEEEMEKFDTDYLLFPNPIKGNNLNIFLQEIPNEELSFIIFNSLGIEVQNGKLNGFFKKLKIVLNDDLSKGIYFISIYGNKGLKFTTKQFNRN